MTSFFSINPIVSKPLAEINQSIKTVGLISDVKKLSLRIPSGRSRADDL